MDLSPQAIGSARSEAAKQGLRNVEYFIRDLSDFDATADPLFELLRRFQQEGVKAVDMESAGLFAVGEVRNIETASVFVIGDSLAGPRWSAPPDLRVLHQRLKTLLDALIDVLSRA